MILEHRLFICNSFLSRSQEKIGAIIKYVMAKKTAVLFISLCFILIFFGFSFGEENLSPPKIKYESAKVIQVRDLSGDEEFIGEQVQSLKVKITSGKLYGKTFDIKHISSGGVMGAQMKLVKGDKIVVYVEEDPTKAESPNGSPLVHVDDYVRIYPLFFLTGIYVFAIIFIGRKKGLRALLSLVLTILLIFFVLFPLIMSGFSPILASIIVAGASSLLVFGLVAGRTRKALSAALGTLIGVAIAGFLATITGKIIHLTGLSSEESKILLYSMNLKINLQGVLFSGILIGALGAVMDVGMSIASAIDEVRKVHPEANFKNLFNCGMNVGRDIMGTMSNTLILAYTGSALPLLLLFAMGDIPMFKILNMELVAEEITRALSGSIGLVLCIPITAFISAVIYTYEK